MQTMFDGSRLIRPTRTRRVGPSIVSVAGILILLLMPAVRAADLVLLTGSPTPKYNSTYPSALYRVTEQGTLALLGMVVSEGTGSEWIAVSHEWKQAVAIPWSFKGEVA